MSTNKPIDKLSIWELEKLREEIYDRWTWETGSEKNKKLIVAITEEIKRQYNNTDWEAVALAEKIKEIWPNGI